MKFTNSKNNFKSLGKDIKGIICSSVCLIKDTLNIPFAFCKDTRDALLEVKSKKLETKQANNMELNAN